MKRYVKFFRLFCLIALVVIVEGVVKWSGSKAEALTYQSSVGVGFTFNPSLNVSLSDSDLVINNLIPGANAQDSNIITVGVSTNVADGYNLSATVGNTNNATTNLANGGNNFVSLTANTASLSGFSNNTWGYSYSVDSGVSWVSGDVTSATIGYAGLPLYTSTGVNLASSNDNTASSVQFKIAAKAGSTQASGTYNNVINFTAVSNVMPVTLLDAFVASNATQLNGYYKMQDMTPAICGAATIGSSMQLIDARDNKLYWVAKLTDNNCWMTQNLDLDLSSSVALNSENSDIDPSTYGSGIYTSAAGYSQNGNVVSWTPSTIVNDTQQADTKAMTWSSNTAATVTGWTDSTYNPYSADAGDRYKYTDASGNETIYTSLNACLTGTNNDTAGCQHMHLGNYYNWSAAVASNDTNGASSSQTNSICPKNWDLPANGKYGTMLDAQDVWAGGTSTDYDTDGYLKIRTSPLYFVQSGIVHSGSLVGFTNGGSYWSSTGYDSYNSYFLVFDASSVNPVYGSRRGYGFPVRCMVGTSS